MPLRSGFHDFLCFLADWLAHLSVVALPIMTGYFWSAAVAVMNESRLGVRAACNAAFVQWVGSNIYLQRRLCSSVLGRLSRWQNVANFGFVVNLLWGLLLTALQRRL